VANKAKRVWLALPALQDRQVSKVILAYKETLVRKAPPALLGKLA
jgi:hypothetical protein